MKFKNLILLTLMAFPALAGSGQTRQCHSDTVRLNVTFPKGSAVIDSTFADNLASLGRLHQLLADSCRDISSITVWGSTSPEGSKRFNRALASRRAENLKSRAIACGAPASIIRFGNNTSIWPDAAEADYPALRAAYIVMDVSRKSVVLTAPGSKAGDSPTGLSDPTAQASTVVASACEQDNTAAPVSSVEPEKDPLLALYLRANLLRWATLTPDVGLELRLHRRFAVVVNGSWTNWSRNDKNRRYALREIAPELRFYIDKECRGYLGAMYKAGAFNYKLSESGKQGNILGGGITGGYVLPLNRILNLDFSLGLGYLHSDFDRYTMSDGIRVRQGKDSKNWWGPISAGITLTCKLFN